MRQAVWRKLMVALHPDKGGDVRVFQHVSALKRQLDAGELVQFDPPTATSFEGASKDPPDETEQLIARVRAELDEAAQM